MAIVSATPLLPKEERASSVLACGDSREHHWLAALMQISMTRRSHLALDPEQNGHHPVVWFTFLGLNGPEWL